MCPGWQPEEIEGHQGRWAGLKKCTSIWKLRVNLVEMAEEVSAS